MMVMTKQMRKKFVNSNTFDAKRVLSVCRARNAVSNHRRVDLWSKTHNITIVFKNPIQNSYLNSKNSFLAFTKGVMARNCDEFARSRANSITTPLWSKSHNITITFKNSV